MRYTHQKEEVIVLAVPYVHLVAVSIIPMMFFQALKQFADGFSITQYSLYVTITANLLNIFLNYLFIYGSWGCPRMGIWAETQRATVCRVRKKLFQVRRAAAAKTAIRPGFAR